VSPRDLLPTWAWLWQPSGGPYPQTGLWGWLVRRKNAPLVAHPLGAVLVVSAFLLVLRNPVLPAIGAALLAEAVNQFYKAVRGVYGGRLWQNVIWRELLALAGALVVAGVWRWLR